MAISTLIENFSVSTLKDFFRKRINTFKPDEENYEYLFNKNDYINENYKDIIKIGEADLTNTDDILVFTAKTLTKLTDRTGKKRQFEIAKKILKEENKDAAFFIFYDDNGNFRFSLIRVNFLGTKREFTDFKRYTYFVSPKQTNKTFINQISKCDFNSLDSIQEAFSVEPITKQFYEKLQRWYFWAIKNVEFPKDAEKETNGREVAIIRLITRLMFIWFMKVRELIPNSLFDEENISKILKDFPAKNRADKSAEESTYYKAILQNLFFATLNTKQNERKFRSETRGAKGYNPDFGNHNLFRYHNLFSKVESLNNLFSKIPFLNGGLFECLDYKTKDKNERKYIDGFTATKENQPKVPNFLFFSKIQKVDISSFFGKANKTYEVEGLINLLNSYNFTIDENEPDDIEVALDPELLGSIFENLLASYNPETATTARKATGSFYTPREIVNYMTNESLKQYLRQSIGIGSILLPNEPKHDDLSVLTPKQRETPKQDTLDTLFDSHSENPFDEQTTKEIIDLINNLRIVDPAVGSGAFPMAMLNKLVFILGKLDPENKHWKQSQIDGVKKSVSDSVVQRKLIEQIERQFKEKNADYGRKLFLIRKCIYGVDIQQIAVEIAKLRFFISLLVDEKIDFDKPENNYGIEPLPNLDFKLMQGNSLISTYAGIDFNDKKEEESDNLLFDENEPYKNLIKEFEELKHQYQNEVDNQIKKELRDKIDKAIIEIFEAKISEHFPELKRIEENAELLPKEGQRKKYITEEKQKLTKRLGFDIEKDLTAYTEARKEKDFFLWNVYFAEVFSEKARTERSRSGSPSTSSGQGFDIVIGNPPYIQLQKAINGKQKFADLYKNENYKTFERTGDIYALFYEKGINILTENGLLCYITSNKWMRANYGKSLRKFFSENSPLKLIDLGPGVFNTATVDTNILIIEKGFRQNRMFNISELAAKEISREYANKNLKAITLTDKDKLNNLTGKDFTILKDLSEESWIILSSEEQKIKQKIERIGTPLKDWDINIYRGVLTGYNEAFIIDGKTKDRLIAQDPTSAEIIKPILRGRDIKRYKAEFGDLWLIATFPAFNLNIENYHAVKEYLEKFLPKIKQSGETYIDENEVKQKTRKKTGNKWFETQDQIAYHKEFEKEKIVYPNMASDLCAYYDNKNYFTNQKCFIVTTKTENLTHLAMFLNSKLINYYFKKNIGATLGLQGFEMSKVFMQNLPIPKISKSEQKPFATLVDKIIAKKAVRQSSLQELGEDTTAEEREIDLMVYKLYELTYEEVKIVEPAFALTENEYNKVRF